MPKNKIQKVFSELDKKNDGSIESISNSLPNAKKAKKVKDSVRTTAKRSKSKVQNVSDVVNGGKVPRIDQDKTATGNEKNLIPLQYKENFDPEINGAAYDADGRLLTQQNQVINSIIEQAPASDKSIAEMGDDIDRASNIDKELTLEQDKARNLIQFTETGLATDDATEAIMTTSDIMNETATLMEDIDAGTLDEYAGMNNLFNNIKTSPVSYGEPAMERLGLQEYYPDINMPLQVGTYSGSIVGSNPIFVAGGGYVPVSILDARKRAMERAAQERVKQGEKIKNLLLVNGAEQYQGQLNEMGLDIFNKYGEAVGWDYSKLTDMRNPVAREFQEEYSQYRAGAARTLKIHKQMDGVVQTWKDGKKYIPPPVWNAINLWQAGGGSVEDMINNPAQFQMIELTMQSYDSMTKEGEALTKQVEKDKLFLDAMVDEEGQQLYADEAEKIMSSSNVDIYRTGTFTSPPIQRLWELSEAKVNDLNMYGDPEQNRVDMFKYMVNLMSTEITPKYISANKRNGTNVTVNIAKDSTTTEETSILSNQPAWRQDLASGINQGDAWIASSMEKNFGLSPVLGADGKFENGEIKADYSISKDQNNQEFQYTANQVKFNGLSLKDYQRQKLKTGYGFSDNQIDDLFAQKDARGGTDVSLRDFLGDDLTMSDGDAYIFSLNGQSTINTKWDKKQYIEKWTDENGQTHTLLVGDSGEHVASSSGYNDISGGIIDPSNRDEVAIFDGVTFSISYDVNKGLGDKAVLDTYNTGTSATGQDAYEQDGIPVTTRDGGAADKKIRL